MFLSARGKLPVSPVKRAAAAREPPPALARAPVQGQDSADTVLGAATWLFGSAVRKLGTFT